ncbi:IS4 family transposase [Ferruginibacter paludis]|uniref:IS4 family transposase n=1 Tax=Ferruginibacter paludis TaxID=1310417 RepID=UPI0025B57537|nr:IS4 family transposase [Ferruginibacter paludis]MDN3657512.1 IS4 family transposase [Ferruginibacter paludis]
MNNGKYVFAQIITFLPARVFDKCVSRYEGNKWVKHFSCWNQLMCMIFGQLSGRESLRDLLITISAHSNKYYHLGLGKNVSRSNLAMANEQRNCSIYESFAYEMIAIAQGHLTDETDFPLLLPGNVYAFDYTTVDLCLNVFWWATFRKAKGAIKIHTLYDVKTSIPAFIHITEGNVHDVKAMDVLIYEADGFYVVDKAYVDFKRLFSINSARAYFVVRAKENLNFRRIRSVKPDKANSILCDQTIKLKSIKSSTNYPEVLRRIKYFDKEQQRIFVFLTNNFQQPATDIALLYKYRWKVELFFKWIKQHLKIKSFWGTSMNAVKTQVYIAIITYTLVAIIKCKLKTNRSTYEILQIISASLFDKTHLNVLLKSDVHKNVKEQKCQQLTMELF